METPETGIYLPSDIHTSLIGPIAILVHLEHRSSGFVIRHGSNQPAQSCVDTERFKGGSPGSKFWRWLYYYYFAYRVLHGRIQRWVQGVRTPWKIKNIGFPSNSDPNPLKITRLASQHSMVGHYRHASGRPFQMAIRWRADDSPL